MARRHSKTPLVLTDASRRVMIAAADRNLTVRTNIETLLGVAWDSLTTGQKIGALTDFEETGFALRSVAGAAEGFKALERAAFEKRDEIGLADRVALLEEQIVAKDETIAARDAEIKRLKNAAARDRTSRVVKSANSARAVHSGEPDAAA